MLAIFKWLFLSNVFISIILYWWHWSWYCRRLFMKLLLISLIFLLLFRQLMAMLLLWKLVILLLIWLGGGDTGWEGKVGMGEGAGQRRGELRGGRRVAEVLNMMRRGKGGAWWRGAKESHSDEERRRSMMWRGTTGAGWGTGGAWGWHTWRRRSRTLVNRVEWRTDDSGYLLNSSEGWEYTPLWI